MASDSDIQISLRCGNSTFLCLKEKLMKESAYFEALYSSTFSDSGKTTHTFPTEVMEPKFLENLVHYINNGNCLPLSNQLFNDLFYTSKAAQYLQIASIEPHLQRLALSRLVPSQCLSQAQLMYSEPTVLGAVLLATCIWRIPWKLYDLMHTEDFLNLSPAELYWLLRNPAMIDPTGGIKGLLAIHHWIEAKHGMNESSETRKQKVEKPHSELCRGVFNRKMCARFVFALVEGLEEKISKDAPLGYCRKAILDGSSLPHTGSDSSPSSQQDPVTNLLDAAPEQPDGAQSQDDSSFEGPLPVTKEDLKVIQRWREDDNVFRHLYETQKKCGWSICFTGLAKGNHNPWKQTSEPTTFSEDPEQAAAGLAIYSFDPNSSSFEHVTDYPDPAFGYRIATHGSEVLVLGGEKRKLGSGTFAAVRHFDFLSRTWTVDDDVDPLIQQRTFLHCWRADGELVLLGGYERYRTKVKKILLVRPSYSDNRSSFVERDTSLSRISDKSHERLKMNFTLQELKHLPEYVVSQRGVLAAVGCHLLLFINKTLFVHCPSRDLWTRRRSLITGAPEQGFSDAIPYGSGIYLTDIQHRVVYWMLVDPEYLAGNIEYRPVCVAPTFHAVVYGNFIREPDAVCRVGNKLYGYSEGSEDVAVEVMHLRYNPFDWVNDLDNPKSPPRAESTPATSGNSSESEPGPADPRSPLRAEVTPTNPPISFRDEVTPVYSEGYHRAEVTPGNPNCRSASDETPVAQQDESVRSPETVSEPQRDETLMINLDESVRSPVTVSESQCGETGSHFTASREDEAMTAKVMKTGMNENERVAIPDILPSIRLMLHAAAHRMIDLPLDDSAFRFIFSSGHWGPTTTHAEAAARRAAMIFVKRVYPHGQGRVPLCEHHFQCWWCYALTVKPSRNGWPEVVTPIEAENVITLPYSDVPWQSSIRGEPISLFAVYDPVKIISKHY